MSIHPRRDTGPELAVRRLLHSAGERYRLQVKVPDHPRRTIDIAFPGARLAIFIDGCFWHGCPVHGEVPVSNREWWIEKIDKNRRRDTETTDVLRRAGWSVSRWWEHESPAVVAAVVRRDLQRLRNERATPPRLTGKLPD